MRTPIEGSGLRGVIGVRSPSIDRRFDWLRSLTGRRRLLTPRT
ncbi:hypothetical protein RBWH47_04140 [Rhodopirellula baltica WH47]|uniref:Uncharacterized protein n=1 Tax=Rhodopirellula baltica WH47 TaxID=991778 RepID=F2B103_RHOBT|nr:hypothetical protein RBWH47_04140 [Rhodopirellula baltica WH47]